MALFGKKKTAENTNPSNSPSEDIQIVGDDADAPFDETDGENNDGPVVDFDAIAQDLNAHDEEADMDSFLGKTEPQNADDAFATAPDFATSPDATNIDEEIDFDATFDDGSPALLETGAPVVTDENPFGNAPNIEPIQTEPTLTTDAPALTYTAPILTSDMAAGGYAPARKTPSLLPLLGAAALLVALGLVGWKVLGSAPQPETAAPVVASSPPTQTLTAGEIVPVTPGSAVPAPGASSNTVNQGLAVDGVPIAPGAVVVTGLAPTVSPALQQQLKTLWNKGAAAKRAGDIAGARAAWTKILQLDPNHQGIQSAIDKLPAA